MTSSSHCTLNRAAALEEAKAKLEAQLRSQSAEVDRLPELQALLASQSAQAAQAARQGSEAEQVV
jgi:hypothetical protein